MAEFTNEVTSDNVTSDESYGELIDLNGNEFEIPDYTVKEIREAIPRECFKKSLLMSLRYVFQDLFLLGITFYVFNTYVNPERIPSYPLRFALWTVYTFLQGLFGSGIWVLAHECGHMAFSDFNTFNDCLGLVLHSALLVPYFSWKTSHKRHHQGIANMHIDTSFVPVTRLAYAQRFGKTWETITEYAEDSPLYTFFYLLFHQLLDWQVYMFIMIGFGEAWYEKQAAMEGDTNPERNEDSTLVRKYHLWGSHYWPYSPIYKPKEATSIWITDIALLIMLSILYWVGTNYGWTNLAVWYGIPYLWVNHWLVSLTYLHHHDPSLGHYNPSAWTYTRGAASTIDRDFGFVGRHLFHNIIETHVLHHHISTIPHYHAAKAADAIKEVMGVHYRKDDKGTGMAHFMGEFWRTSKACSWVEPSEGAKGMGKDVLFFRNRTGVGVAPATKRHFEGAEKLVG